ncbi:glycosyltransferase family 4 protein [Enterococcus sp. DIV0242_7C1]|uniref:Glycosyl transferase, group 1 family protein n=1 Tax=Candidatus Enterococcus dunnyi TaxID=1834192 RepID=A0A200JCF1_9ENTE|nr:glycosyltransferase family 4 protein [Enterococcus sp. 9D6_DIV0238]MBO0471672.1 glycosyltransferase family 4 protein [Enterococcus sp. DIV0242_7C1]OUZ34531.1 glycosyl transferase, group 1 family protein [Enterococcus sp. 9D6_DIV0238]
MKFGFFTDTYFPQVSGVATSIKTLKEELEKKGHQVYIFTTTDPNAKEFEEDVIRMPSVPFVSFKDRRIVVRGMWYAYLIAKELELDLIHTHTEFGAGLLGKMVGKKLKIPVIHTYHTMYEDYLHYIAKGKVVRPTHVKYFSRFFANHTTGVVCPSERVIDKLREYGVTAPMRIIPTGIDIKKFERPDITEQMKEDLREELGLTKENMMLLSLSRISYEKNIQAIIQGLPIIFERFPNARFVIVGDGPYVEKLSCLAEDLNIREKIQFVGEVPNDQVAIYYKAADYFVSASTSETQGLTYTEAMASGVPCVVEGNAYLNNLFDHESLGHTFESDDEFASAFIAYVESGIKPDETILKDKLYEISASYFGNRMFEFYEDMIKYYDQRLVEKEAAASIERIKVKFTSLRK